MKHCLFIWIKKRKQRSSIQSEFLAHMKIHDLRTKKRTGTFSFVWMFPLDPPSKIWHTAPDALKELHGGIDYHLGQARLADLWRGRRFFCSKNFWQIMECLEILCIFRYNTYVIVYIYIYHNIYLYMIINLKFQALLTGLFDQTWSFT